MKRNYKNKFDNRGIAMVSVLLTVMLCFLLSGTILRLSYLALLSRNVDRASTNTFYNAESVVDDIRMELQKASAAALNVSGATDGAAFINTVYTMLTNGDPSKSPEENAESYISSHIVAGATVDIQGTIITTNESLVIKDVHVSYVDPQTGYESDIVTDIRINAPYFASSETHPIGTYSMFAGGGANVASGYPSANLNQYGNLTQEGNVYIGYMTYNASTQVAKACEVKDYMTFTLDGDNIVINGDVYISNHSNLVVTGENVEVRGVIYLSGNSHLIIGESTNLVAQDVVIENKSVFNGAYSASAMNKYDKGLPKKYFNQSGSPYISNNSSIVYYNGSQCFDAVVNGGIIKNQSSMPLDEVVLLGQGSAECKPHPNILAADGNYYDERYLEIIDVEYFAKMSLSPVGNYKNPRAHLNPGTYRETSDGKFVFDVLSSYGDQNSYRTFQYSATQSTQVEVNFGTLSEIANPGIYIIVKYGDLRVPMNSGNTYTGLFMATDTVEYSQTGAETKGVSLLSVDTTSDLQYLKAYLDNLGECMMYNQVSGYSVSDYQCLVINNFFKGGIKVFYETAGSEGSGSEGSITEENQINDLIQLENWNKH